ncbi:hypothetical protein HN448_06020, partial [archaeon]|nr:hypothetical protein [archaeon]
LLEKNINEFEDFVREVFKEEKSSDLSLAIDSYHHFIDKIKSIQNPNKIIIPFEVFNSFYQSLDKNQDLNELTNLGYFYSHCIDNGKKCNLRFAGNLISNLISYDIMEVFDDFKDAYLSAGTNNFVGPVIYMFGNLCYQKEGISVLKDLMNYVGNFHDHEMFKESCNILEKSLEREFKIFNSYLIKFPGFMQPRSNFKHENQFKKHHNFENLKNFIISFEYSIDDPDLKYKLNYDEMIITSSTHDLVINYCRNNFENDLSTYSYVIRTGDDIFFHHLNEAISYGETLEQKRESMTYWCKEVQRMIKSGAYDDELRLMFGCDAR